MEKDTLLEDNHRLLKENIRLTEENRQLKARLGMMSAPSKNGDVKPINEEKISDELLFDRSAFPNLTSQSDSRLKISLFMSLFNGREDVYAKRWENREKSGYSPVCANQWRSGVCGKPNISCAKCPNKAYAALDEAVIEDHLRGKITAGIYPMLPDETCFFLAMDFDEEEWQKDISMVRDVCDEFDIPAAVERSRSGNGGHIWFFFEEKIPAGLARKFGMALLTYAMDKRHEIRFRSYDRLFPNQNTMPKGGLGNLIALPLQKAAREMGNSEFVDENFMSHPDQWAFLSSIQKLTLERIEGLISRICPGHELGVLKTDDEDDVSDRPKPWETRKISLSKTDFPDHVNIHRANMLFVPKAGFSQRALNRLKRLASFKNPMFLRHQAMRLSTYGHPPVISCADETPEYVCLPRGCEAELTAELKAVGADVQYIDKTNPGKSIDVSFNGRLRDEQVMALEQLLHHDIGILCGTTAFGKTIVAIKLIAERKVNTLILVDKVSLLAQWKNKLSEFLIIKETTPEPTMAPGKTRGRKKQTPIIGQLGAGKDILTGIVDIAVMQSLSRQGEVRDCVQKYGMIIADECHHAPAFSYEAILKTARARYVYGLTATPSRKDGHHPILFMHCGPIRYRDNPKKQADNRPFHHYIIPRFTSLRVPLDRDEKEMSIQALYGEIAEDEFRNQQIVEDVLKNYNSGRNCIVLTLRTGHVATLAQKLREIVPDLIILTGGMGAKTTREAFRQIESIPPGKPLLIVATGHFIGEGFDEPRLDTLFLAMPISWKGTLQQYAGRLHRLSAHKKEVRIYDYVDIQIKVLEKMYQKRLAGYAAMGYAAKGEDMPSASLDIIFNKDNFLPVFSNDIAAARKEILIVSPFVRERRTARMMEVLKPALVRKLRVIVVTRPPEDFKKMDPTGLLETLELLKTRGIHVVYKSHIHQKFAVVDQKAVWYGSINLLSYGTAQESIMRIESTNIANELTRSMELS